MKAGLTKIPLTRANLDECFAPLTTERSRFVYTPFGTDATKFSRDMGVVFSGNFFEDHLKYFFAIMEGREGPSRFTTPTDLTFHSSPEPDDKGFEYVFRFHYSFLDPEGGPTAMGYKGTYLGKRGKILTIGAGIAYQANAAYKHVVPAGPKGTPGFFNAKVLDDDTVDYTAYTADLFMEIPILNSGDWLTFTALYLKVDLDDAYKTVKAPADLNTVVGGLLGQKEGYYVKAGYILPFRVFDEGMIQPFARYEHWDVDYLYGVYDQTVEEYGIGFNFFPFGNDRLRFAFEYTWVDFDKKTPLGDYIDQSLCGAHDPHCKKYDDVDIFTLEFMIQL